LLLLLLLEHRLWAVVSDVVFVGVLYFDDAAHFENKSGIVLSRTGDISIFHRLLSIRTFIQNSFFFFFADENL